VRFHKQADKMNHEAHAGHRSQNKSSIIINQINKKSQQNIEIAAI